MKTIQTLLLIILTGHIILFPISLTASEEKKSNENKNEWRFSLGTKAVNSSGISESNTYYKPDFRAGIYAESISLYTGISRYIHYQITSGYGEYEYIDINEAYAGLDLYPFEHLNLFVEYRHRSGDSDYIKKEVSGSIEFPFEKVSLIGDIGIDQEEYTFVDFPVEIQNYQYSFEFDITHFRRLGIDLSYTHSTTYFTNLDYSYYKRIVRFGIVPEPFDSFFLICGLSAGKDSDDYTIYGFDAGINWRIIKNLKIQALYIYSYYMPPPESTSEKTSMVTRSGGNNNPWNTENQSNPYLEADKIGEPYESHKISLGITFMY